MFHLFFGSVMKKIIVLVMFIFCPLSACQKIIDCQSKSSVMQPHVHQNLKPYEPEFELQGKKLYSLGEYINRYYETKTYIKKEPGPALATFGNFLNIPLVFHPKKIISNVFIIQKIGSLQRVICTQK